MLTKANFTEFGLMLANNLFMTYTAEIIFQVSFLIICCNFFDFWIVLKTSKMYAFFGSFVMFNYDRSLYLVFQKGFTRIRLRGLADGSNLVDVFIYTRVCTRNCYYDFKKYV